MGYQVVFTGLKKHVSQQIFVQHCINKLSMSEDQARALASSTSTVIKRGVSHEKAKRIADHLSDLGAWCTVQPDSSDQTASPGPRNHNHGQSNDRTAHTYAVIYQPTGASIDPTHEAMNFLRDYLPQHNDEKSSLLAHGGAVLSYNVSKTKAYEAVARLNEYGIPAHAVPILCQDVLESWDKREEKNQRAAVDNADGNRTPVVAPSDTSSSPAANDTANPDKSAESTNTTHARSGAPHAPQSNRDGLRMAVGIGVVVLIVVIVATLSSNVREGINTTGSSSTSNNSGNNLDPVEADIQYLLNHSDPSCQQLGRTALGHLQAGSDTIAVRMIDEAAAYGC